MYGGKSENNTQFFALVFLVSLSVLREKLKLIKWQAFY